MLKKLLDSGSDILASHSFINPTFGKRHFSMKSNRFGSTVWRDTRPWGCSSYGLSFHSFIHTRIIASIISSLVVYSLYLNII